jgi:hypothetical protein
MPLEHAKYFVEPEKEGCRRCGEGKTWNVIGPDDLALSTTFEDKDDAEHHASILNEAWRLGYVSGTRGDAETPRETLDRLLAEDGLDTVLRGLRELHVDTAEPDADRCVAILDYARRCLTGGEWPVATGVGPGLLAIVEARFAQIAQGYDAAHDDTHEANGELAAAAGWFIYSADPERHQATKSPGWGDKFVAKHRGDQLALLTNAGALIAAEIDRLKRAEAKAPPIEAQAADLGSAHPSGVEVPEAAPVADEVRF